MMQYELELAQVKGGQPRQVPITLGAQEHLAQKSLLMHMYPSNTAFSQDKFAFGTNATTTFPSLPSATWSSSESSHRHQ
jgi:hypothetical protein